MEERDLQVLAPPDYEPLAPHVTWDSACGLVVCAYAPPSEIAEPEVRFTNRRLATLQRASPRTPVFLVLSRLEPLSSSLLRGARAIRCRGVLVGTPTLAELRPLTTDESIVNDARAWLRLHSRLGEHELSSVSNLVAAGLGGPPDAASPAGTPMPGSTDVPAASRWLRLGRALSSALAIQRHPDWTAARLAFHLGFHDASSLSRHLHRAFGHRPAFVRARLGWDWLLREWCRRNARLVSIARGVYVRSPTELREMWVGGSEAPDTSATAG